MNLNNSSLNQLISMLSRFLIKMKRYKTKSVSNISQALKLLTKQSRPTHTIFQILKLSLLSSLISNEAVINNSKHTLCTVTC